MNKKILWCWLSLLLVAALVLASCGPKEEVVKKGELYGGSLTIGMPLFLMAADPASPDIADGFRTQLEYLHPIQETPLMGNFEKYGPRGTGEFSFQVRGFVPPAFRRGWLIEDWEVSQEKVVWHVRPGIYWQGRDVMESRELVAEDVVADLLYFREAPGGAGFKKISGNIYATDRYTLEIEFSEGYTLMLMYLVGIEDRAHISPPEIEGSDSWDDQVGTGPFMLKEYVPGSHMTYERNPNYWKTTTINGVEYQLPFVDELTMPIIPDMSTQIAALRTGKLDFHEMVAPTYWETLKGDPELEFVTVFGSAGNTAFLKQDEPPLNDVNIRRALMIGTDMKAFGEILDVGPLPIDWFPAYPGDASVYTPMEKLPAEARILYDYNPVLAKQMLADAGYPGGLRLEIACVSTPDQLDRASLLAGQWAKIGIEAEIKSYDATTYGELSQSRQHKHVWFPTNVETSDIIVLLSRWFLTGVVLNQNDYSNEDVDELIAEMVAEMDAGERNRLAKEAALIVLNDVAMIPLQPTLNGHFWWPWLKNYYGERNAGDYANPIPLLSHLWIDQDLKAEMGY